MGSIGALTSNIWSQLAVLSGDLLKLSPSSLKVEQFFLRHEIVSVLCAQSFSYFSWLMLLTLLLFLRLLRCVDETSDFNIMKRHPILKRLLQPLSDDVNAALRPVSHFKSS